MPKQRKADALFFDSESEGAFIEFLDGIIRFAKLLAENKSIRKTNPELTKALDLIVENSELIKEAIKLTLPIMPNTLKMLSNLLKQGSTLLKSYKPDSTLGSILSAASGLFSQLAKINISKERERDTLDDVEKAFLSAIDEMRANREKMLKKPRAKDRSDLVSFVDAGLQFSTQCREKLFDLFRVFEKTLKAEDEEFDEPLVYGSRKRTRSSYRG